MLQSNQLQCQPLRKLQPVVVSVCLPWSLAWYGANQWDLGTHSSLHGLAGHWLHGAVDVLQRLGPLCLKHILRRSSCQHTVMRARWHLIDTCSAMLGGVGGAWHQVSRGVNEGTSVTPPIRVKIKATPNFLGVEGTSTKYIWF